MKKIIFLFIFLFCTFVFVNSVNAQEPDRVRKCCQVVTSDGATYCNENEFVCKSSSGTPTGDFTAYPGKCVRSVPETSGGGSFYKGKCQDTLANKSGTQLNDLELVGTKAGYANDQKDTNAIVNYIGKIIKTALGLTGLIFLIYAIYSGIQWMTAGGNASQVSEARNRLIQAAIGMMISAVAYTAAALVITIIGSSS